MIFIIAHLEIFIVNRPSLIASGIVGGGLQSPCESIDRLLSYFDTLESFHPFLKYKIWSLQ